MTRDDFEVWPPGASIEEASFDVRCESCGRGWKVHPILIGNRLRCRCSQWLTIRDCPSDPGGFDALPQPAADDGLESRNALAASNDTRALAANDEAALVRSADASGHTRHIEAVLESTLDSLTSSSAPPKPVAPHELRGLRTVTGEALEPDDHGEFTMRDVHNADRQRYATRALLELCGMVAAFWLPMAFIHWAYVGKDRALALPVADVMAGLLCLAVARSHPRLALEGLRMCAPRYFVEAIVAGVAALGIAFAWIAIIESAYPMLSDDWLASLREDLGLPVALFVIAFVPGFFEEIAFRGLILGRARVFYGTRLAIAVSAAAFALAHGVGLATPLHMGIGYYLGWLRVRSGSLVPGMILHAGYNGSLLVLG